MICYAPFNFTSDSPKSGIETQIIDFLEKNPNSDAHTIAASIDYSYASVSAKMSYLKRLGVVRVVDTVKVQFGRSRNLWAL
ncbi:hypothetical protein [Phaeocystidibacter marisrubri]|uniref:Winged helix-turn-helix transcriptional regulator n=1 Tax=Phaeocystidibacter marisrubri TaxID=1577780 RepID=A0A6L3ZCQ0_9FLAO|nr:hypothetical protein [Phaeocystidibacter marisrubri]KAB2815003.1 hypothetical protein F8C82_14645 [Phaeocystidibacter marisrubri]GGH64208.1 hypothetical protein GCM10011318_00010 [Phaeocystidibacter marisrubri]